jgi:uncharacterized membrane protein YccC
MFLTPQFVLISSLADPFISDVSLAWARGVDSVLAGIIAVLAARLLWPRHRPGELPALLGAAIASNRDYLKSILDAQQHPAQPNAVDAIRRRAGLASNNAEATLERMLVEPGIDSATTEAVMTIVTSARRLTGTITLLWLLPPRAAAELSSSRMRGVVAWITEALDVMAKAVTSQQTPGPLPENAKLLQSAPPEEAPDVLATAARQVEILQASLMRLDLPTSSTVRSQ